MAFVFSSAEGIITAEYLEKESIFKGFYYADQIRLRERPSRLQAGVLFHQANSPLAVSMVAIWEIGFKLLEYLSYSPGQWHLLLALFKEHFWSTKFEDDSEVIAIIGTLISDFRKKMDWMNWLVRGLYRKLNHFFNFNRVFYFPYHCFWIYPVVCEIWPSSMLWNIKKWLPYLSLEKVLVWAE